MFKDVFEPTTMEQLGEPILVTNQFIKMVEQSIQSIYERILQDVFEQLQKDIDSRYIDLSNKDT